MKVKTLDDHPEWQTEQKKLIDWQLEYAAVDQEINRIVSHRDSENDRDVFADAAEALLMGKDVAVPPAGNDEAERELRFKRRVLGKAITMQRDTLDALRRRLSMDLCNEARPEYNRIIKEMATASEKLLTVIKKEEALRHALGGGNVVTDYLFPVFPSVTGRLETFLNDAKSAGYI